jgi:nitroreductase
VPSEPRSPSSDPPFFDVALHQRACRHFDGRPVPDDLLEQCLRAATHAPSAENTQPWVFVVVRDAGLREEIADLYRRAWRQFGRPHSEHRIPRALLEDVERGAEVGMHEAPVLVVVCGDRTLAVESTLASSVYPATQNLLLAAGALGLGSALTTLVTVEPSDLGRLLRLPASVLPMAVVPLGWPARTLGPPRRRPVSERAHLDRYGQPFPA